MEDGNSKLRMAGERTPIERFADAWLSPVAKVGAILLITLGYASIVLLSGLYAFDNGSWGKSLWLVFCLWVFVFNKLPTQGLACLKDPANKFLLIPLAALSTLVFVVAYFYRAGAFSL